jgi:SAM-dependent methyltransferase
MTTPKSIWNNIYATAHRDAISEKYDNWMNRWRPLLEQNVEAPALDIGCGIGLDTRYLTALGYITIAIDLSNNVLTRCQKAMPDTPYLQVDISEGLPFIDNCFQIITANLSLHYFNQAETAAIINDIQRCLKPRGFLLARFNSTNDSNYGSVGHKEIEPNLFLVNGLQKKFFDRQTLSKLLDASWEVHAVEELQVDRYSKPKLVWELVAEKM